MIRLASSSATRAKLLREAGISFFQESVDFDEDSIVSCSPKNFVYQAAIGKYEANLKEFGKEYPLLVADTVVSARGKILRKAKSAEEAKEILLMQSGSAVSIITCMIFESLQMKIVDMSCTTYLFREFDIDDVERFLQSGEWMGKAGACMVEGFCKPYIQSTQGYQSTAMGLNLEVLKRFM